MKPLGRKSGQPAAAFCVLVFAMAAQAQQTFSTELQIERDPGRRAEKALAFAEESFESAREAYSKGQIKQGDTLLESMTNVLKLCVDSLETARKVRFSKKAELHVATLQRRLQGLVEDLDIPDRGWAEYTARKLDEIHDALLTEVMRK